MRLFVALELPPQALDLLVALKADLPIPAATWVKPAALHLTLRFLGDHLDPIRLTPIKTALASIKSAPFPLTLHGTGRFPPQTKRPARVLWVGIADQPALIALQVAVEHALAEVAFPPAEHSFSPHITLARLKSETTPPHLKRFLKKHGAFHVEPFTISEFYLVSSVLTPDGPLYRHEAAFPLTV